jgi:two-component system, LytTR family, sensor kinase
MKNIMPYIFICLVLTGLHYYLIYSIGAKVAIESLDEMNKGVMVINIAVTSLILLFSYLRLAKTLSFKKFPGLRFSLTYGMNLFLILASVFLFSYYLQEVFAETNVFPSDGFKFYRLNGVIVSIILCLLFSLGDFSWYTYYRFEAETLSKLRETRRRKELQFEVLKEQLTPHYLFNSLNTASNLITAEPQQAELFLRKLGNNFQFLVEHSKEPLNTLENELEIVNSYFHLMKVRFGEKIKLTIEVDKDLLKNKIPSLGMQMLVENAFKHNTASMDKPVEVLIKADKKGIVVENNKTTPPATVHSTGTGLKNLVERYEYLSEDKVRVFHSINFYSVTLPYVKSQKELTHV